MIIGYITKIITWLTFKVEREIQVNFDIIFTGLRHRVCIRRNQAVHGNRDVTVTFQVTRVLHVIFVIILCIPRLWLWRNRHQNRRCVICIRGNTFGQRLRDVIQFSCHAWNYDTTKLWDYENMRLWNYETIKLWNYGTETEIESETETQSMKL